MQIKLITIGKKMPNWIQTGIEHYQKQITNFELISIESQKRKSQNSKKTKELEQNLLIKSTKGSNVIIAFDENGKQHSSKSIANFLKISQENNDNIAFLIGGADGLSDDIKKNISLWSLSKLTLPHSFARLIAVEQIYRAYSILNNHPYHRQ